MNAKPTIDNQTGETVVSFTFDRVGAKKFGRVTTDNVRKILAIILDNNIISAPVIREPILGGNGQISGNFTFQSATDLALLLRSGSLPAPLKIIEERTVGPDLGEDSIKSGAISLAIGFFLVIIFMIYRYRDRFSRNGVFAWNRALRPRPRSGNAPHSKAAPSRFRCAHFR